MFTSASGGSVNGVTYVDAQGCYQIYTGGDRNWRNNNPGNLKAGEFATSRGAIGEDTGGYAIFPDYQTGMDALKNLLNTTYAGRTVGQMIDLFAPASDGNNPQAYKDFLEGRGFPPDDLIGEYDSDELAEFADAMAYYEGHDSGSISSMVCPGGSGGSTEGSEAGS